MSVASAGGPVIRFNYHYQRKMISMASFDKAVEQVLLNEGILEDNPNDPGGITKYGISLRFLKNLQNQKQYGFDPETIDRDTIQQLTDQQAKALYYGEFWQRSHFEQLTTQSICNYIFDMAINMGIAPAIKCAQRAVWAFAHNRNCVVDDGIMGEHTIGYINLFGAALMPALRSERAGDYRVIVNLNSMQREFLEGWLNRAYEG